MQDSQSAFDAAIQDSPTGAAFDLSFLPPVYVLASRLSISEQQDAEDTLSRSGASLTYDIKEANLVLGNISKKRRARSELQWKGVRAEEIDEREILKHSIEIRSPGTVAPARKKRKLRDKDELAASTESNAVLTDSSTASDTGDEVDPDTESMSQLSIAEETMDSLANSSTKGDNLPSSLSPGRLDGKIAVVNIAWLNESVKAHRCLPIGPHIIYQAQLTPLEKTRTKPPLQVRILQGSLSPQAKVPPRNLKSKFQGNQRYNKRHRVWEAADQDFLGRSFSSTQGRRIISNHHGTHHPELLHETTSEHDEVKPVSLPPMPEWVLQHTIYSCERATPPNPPNQDFISQLEKIRIARILTLDEIGVRAYSTSIAAIAAYPYPIQASHEIVGLPGCDRKIAHLFHEYQTTNGRIQAVADIDADPSLRVLREFYEIWGVGAVTAREFYYDKNWRDLDDVVEHGWTSLSRVQQIGLKYYDEFHLKISRSETESIAAIISARASAVVGPGLETIIVGGYRRGKPESNDVDVILSHPSESKTQDLVEAVVASLEQDGYITHKLIVNLTNSKRHQETLPINPIHLGGHGFDTLDKALVVWQDPTWPSRTEDLAANPKAKNPNPHRRVDIIISPWRTVGCAVAGWTSGTTFQRDLRRYAKHVKGLKFDSSGVRERGTGKWVDLEGWRDEETRCTDWRVAERRVFEGMGLVYREPEERCTG